MERPAVHSRAFFYGTLDLGKNPGKPAFFAPQPALRSSKIKGTG